jgi:hypothetical protein
MDLEQLQFGLLVSSAVSASLLGLAIYLAHRHLVRAHLVAVGGFLGSFLVTLYFAEVLGRRYEFDHVSFPIHMAASGLTVATLLVVLGTGLGHWRGRVSRTAHKGAVWAFGVSLALALTTGAWMLRHGELRLPAEPHLAPSAPAPADPVPAQAAAAIALEERPALGQPDADPVPVQPAPDTPYRVEFVDDNGARSVRGVGAGDTVSIGDKVTVTVRRAGQPPRVIPPGR